MPYKKSLIVIIILLISAVSIHIFSSNPAMVERFYSIGLYPLISHFLKFIFGWLPYSVGDILYGFFTGLLLWKLAKIIKAALKNEITKERLKEVSYKAVIFMLQVYVLFNLLWGINYNRKGIVGQLGISVEKYSSADLKNIDSLLLLKVNDRKMAAIRQAAYETVDTVIFNRAISAYQQAEKQYPFLQYQTVSLKKSMWGWLGNYLGFTGYYNPFTGEAQVNTTVPRFLQPFTTCHEIAHQLGYAKEDEANFVGYLAASASTDTFFHYSVYLDLFIYANRNLYAVDSSAAKSFAKQLLPEVRADLKEWDKFNRQHRNPVEPVIHWMYGKYLEGNQQPLGVLSYDEVTGYLIAYYKKFRKI